MQSNITLAVNTDNIKDVERALVSASAAVGWSLQRTRRGWRAEPLQNEGNAVFISCMTYEPVNVPKYLYGYAVRSDSIKCAKRDSVAAVSDSVEKCPAGQRATRAGQHRGVAAVGVATL